MVSSGLLLLFRNGLHLFLAAIQTMLGLTMGILLSNILLMSYSLVLAFGQIQACGRPNHRWFRLAEPFTSFRLSRLSACAHFTVRFVQLTGCVRALTSHPVELDTQRNVTFNSLENKQNSTWCSLLRQMPCEPNRRFRRRTHLNNTEGRTSCADSLIANRPFC